MTKGAKSRRTNAERREEAEGKLIAAATELLAERGYSGFSVADVGEAAGYSRGLSTHYFGSKEELLGRVAENVVEAYLESMPEWAGREPGMPQLTGLVEQYTKARSSVGSRAFVILISEALIEPRVCAVITRLNHRGLAGLETLLTNGVEAGKLRADFDVSAMARLIYAFLRGHLLFRHLDPGFEEVGVRDEFITTLSARLLPNP